MRMNRSAVRAEPRRFGSYMLVRRPKGFNTEPNGRNSERLDRKDGALRMARAQTIAKFCNLRRQTSQFRLWTRFYKEFTSNMVEPSRKIVRLLCRLVEIKAKYPDGPTKQI